MKETWNSRYNSSEYIYGIAPNIFFSSFIEMNPPGYALLPADGEGRNSVFAAMQRWQVDAFDYSESACNKALQLAKKNNVVINYTISDIHEYKTNKKYDLIALIYLHLIPEERSVFFKKLSGLLKPGGHIILEAFSKNQIHNSSGGPKDNNLLYDLSEIKTDFFDLQIKILKEEEIYLEEGLLHRGKANVVRLIAQKN